MQEEDLLEHPDTARTTQDIADTLTQLLRQEMNLNELACFPCLTLFGLKAPEEVLLESGHGQWPWEQDLVSAKAYSAQMAQESRRVRTMYNTARH